MSFLNKLFQPKTCQATLQPAKPLRIGVNNLEVRKPIQPKYGYEFRSLTKQITHAETGEIFAVTIYALVINYTNPKKSKSVIFPDLDSLMRHDFTKTNAKTQFIKPIFNAINAKPESKNYQLVSLINSKDAYSPYDENNAYFSKFTVNPAQYHHNDYVSGQIKTCVYITQEDLRKLEQLNKETGQLMTLQNELSIEFKK